MCELNETAWFYLLSINDEKTGHPCTLISFKQLKIVYLHLSLIVQELI